MMRVGVFVGKRCDVMAILPYTYIYSVNANNNNGQSKEQIEGGTNCIYSKWLAPCKKPARRRPFKCDFRAARQGLYDAPPPRVTLSWPDTCWILLLRCSSPSSSRPPSCVLYAVYIGALSVTLSIQNVLIVLAVSNVTVPLYSIMLVWLMCVNSVCQHTHTHIHTFSLPFSI